MCSMLFPSLVRPRRTWAGWLLFCSRPPRLRRGAMVCGFGLHFRRHDLAKRYAMREHCAAVVAEHGGEPVATSCPSDGAHCAASISVRLTWAPVMLAVLNQMKHFPSRCAFSLLNQPTLPAWVPLMTLISWPLVKLVMVLSPWCVVRFDGAIVSPVQNPGQLIVSMGLRGCVSGWLSTF